MKIVFTKHALKKFKTHEAAGWKFSKKDIKETIKNPYFSETNVERGVNLVLKRWDTDHDLEKGRYVK